jgi:putative ABC transport system substrate-binding protein
MDRRCFLLTSLAAALAAPLVAEAQQVGKVYRIGYLGAGTQTQSAPILDPLRQRLKELGWVEGQNVAIEYRWADGNYDRLHHLAAELLALKVDILVTAGTPGALAAKQATTTIPIVMVGSGDAVASGLVASLARPGGNVTGSTDSVPELMAKLLELIKEAMPRTRRVAVLLNPENPSSASMLTSMSRTAESVKVTLQAVELRRPDQFEAAFATMVRSRVDAIVVTTDGLFNVNVRTIAELAGQKRLFAAGTKAFAEAGGSIGYGLNFSEMARRAANYVDKIFKGAKPSELPVEQPTKFELVINLKTAKALGLTIPPSLLLRADHVIE